jgi:hypothetical protein
MARYFAVAVISAQCIGCDAGGLYIVETKDAGESDASPVVEACQFKDTTLCDAGLEPGDPLCNDDGGATCVTTVDCPPDDGCPYIFECQLAPDGEKRCVPIPNP